MIIKPVILSGGSGTRLWPASRSSLPKQFINFSNNKNLFYQTLKRSKNLNLQNELLVISSRQHAFLCKNEARKLNLSPEYILEETGRNTASAVFFAALNSHPDTILCISPSDHWIEDNKNYKKIIKSGLQLAKKGQWVTFGIKPYEPATGYGYIKTINKENDTFKVEKFVEKPNLKKAIKFLNHGNYFWNSGIFLVSAKKCIDSFKKFQPELVKKAELCWKKKLSYNDEKILLKNYLNKIPAISLDYAIMEFEKDISLIPFDIKWSDLGNWDTLSKYILNNQRNDIEKNKSFLIDSKDTFIYSDKRVIAGIGLEDLIIIDNDDATLILKRGHEEKVKNIIEKLKNSANLTATEHTFEYRPWGKFENILDTKLCKVKKLIVNPGEHLSYQYHKKRSEHWVVIQGQATIKLNKKKFVLNKGESIDIPLGAHHALGNETKSTLILIEIQLGTYFGEDDIIRLNDPYNR